MSIGLSDHIILNNQFKVEVEVEGSLVEALKINKTRIKARRAYCRLRVLEVQQEQCIPTLLYKVNKIRIYSIVILFTFNQKAFYQRPSIQDGLSFYLEQFYCM